MSYIDNIGLPVTNKRAREIVKESLSDIDYKHKNIKEIGEDNRLSTVYSADNKYIVKLVTLRDLELHRLMSFLWSKSIKHITGDNLFEAYSSPYMMVKYEYDILNNIYSNIKKINVPEPVYIGDRQKIGVLIIEKIDNINDFSEVKKNKYELINKLYSTINTLHKNNIIHGDLHTNNIFVKNSENIIIIDPTKIDNSMLNHGINYDIACSIASVSKIVDYNESVRIARKYFNDERLIEASKYMKPISLQFGYNFFVRELEHIIKNEIESNR